MKLCYIQPLGLSPQGIPKKNSAAVADGLLGGFFGLIGNVMQNDTNDMISRRNAGNVQRTNEMNYKIHQEQMQYAKEQYLQELHEQRRKDALAREQYLSDRDYDSPIQKMNRLRLAGLNPYLNYGDTSNYSAGMVQSSTPSMQIPSAPTMVAPQYSPNPNAGDYGKTLANMFLTLSDMSYRDEQNKREWFKTLADAPIDEKTKDLLMNYHVFEGDDNQKALRQLLDERVNSAIHDNTLKMWQINMQQESSDEMRKQWKRNEDLHKKTMSKLTAELTNLGKQGKLFDEEGKLKKAAVKLIEEEVRKMEDFKKNTPEWVQKFSNFFQRALGGSALDVLRLFK